MALQVRLCGALLLCSIVFCTVESTHEQNSTALADEHAQHSSTEAPMSFQEVGDAFHAFDRNDDSFIDEEEFALMVRTRRRSISEEEIDELMKDGDKNIDGMVDFSEFYHMIENVQ